VALLVWILLCLGEVRLFVDQFLVVADAVLCVLIFFCEYKE